MGPHHGETDGSIRRKRWPTYAGCLLLACAEECELGRDFSCVGKYDWPATEAGEKQLRYLFYDEQQRPWPNWDVRLCLSLSCDDDEVDSYAVPNDSTDEGGFVELTVDVGRQLYESVGYVLVQDPRSEQYPVQIMLSPAPILSGFYADYAIFTKAVIDVPFVLAGGGVLEEAGPDEGSVWAFVRDCSGLPARHVTVEALTANDVGAGYEPCPDCMTVYTNDLYRLRRSRSAAHRDHFARGTRHRRVRSSAPRAGHRARHGDAARRGSAAPHRPCQPHPHLRPHVSSIEAPARSATARTALIDRLRSSRRSSLALPPVWTDSSREMTSQTTSSATKPQPNDDYRFGAPPQNLPKLEPAPTGRSRDRGAVRINVVDLSRKADRKRFLDVADAIQGSDPNYISPLRMERMKFLDPAHNQGLASLSLQAMIAVRNGKDVGRITGHIDRAYDAYHDVKAGWFGFFEAIDDVAVAHPLLDEAVAWVKAQGAHEIIGPNNFTTNHQCGLLVENFDRPPFVEMTYNPRYYEKLITSYGFARAKDLLTFAIDVSKGTDDPKIKRYHDVSEKVKKRYGLRLRHPDLTQFEAEVAKIFALYNDSWQKNWGFVPVGEQEFRNIAADLKQIIRAPLVQIVEDKDGKPVAFAVCLPNINEVMPRNGRLFPFGWVKLLTGMKKIKDARLMVLGVIPGYRQRGIEGMMCIETALRAKDMGIRGGEIGWTLEDNVAINNTVMGFGGKLDRRYRLFGIDLR